MAAARVRRRPVGQGGFTLVELLVTLSVAVIGFTGALAIHVTSVRTNALAAASADALTIAQRTLEEARSLSLDAMFREYEDDGVLPIDYDFGGATVLGRTDTFQRRIVVDKVGATGLMEVRVEVSWGEDGALATDPTASHMVFLEILRTEQESL